MEFLIKKLSIMAAAMAALALLIASPAWPQTPESAAGPPAVIELPEGASEAERDEALQAIREWVQRDFAAARPVVVNWIQDPNIPVQLRSQLLRSAIGAARSASASDFDTQAAPVYRDLVGQLPAGEERAILHQAYGNLLIARGQFEQAESLYRQSMDESQDRDIGERANLRSALGVALAQQGRLDEALDEMLQSYRLYDQTEAGPSVDLLRNIGGLSIYLEDWDQAVAFSRLAIEMLEPDDIESLGTRSNLSAALIEQGELEAALETLEGAMAISEAQGQPRASVVNNLGYVLRELGRPEDALAQFERAAELNRTQNDPSSLAVSLKNIGETLILLDRRADADAILSQSLDTYREADIKPKRLELYPVLVDNLEQLGRYPEALGAMREYRELTEELASADALTRVAELQTAFDLERRDRELAESERERLSRESQLFALQSEQALQRLVRWGLIAGLVALSLFLLLLLRSLWSRTRANRLLAEKNTEIEVQRKAVSETNTLLHRQSVEDELTKLGNRRSVRQLLESALPSSLRNKPSLLILIDLDRFKGINDRFGHAAGDAVLSSFADVLRDLAGPEDVLVRWGGEEFLWLVADASIEQAADRCRELADQVKAASFEVSGRRLTITCSMGVAAVDLSTSEPQQAFDLALKVADAALYEAKTEGRNRWVGFVRRLEDYEPFAGSLDIPDLVSKGALTRINGPNP